MIDIVMTSKLIGAITGSSIAVLFKKKDKSITDILCMFVIGIIIGFISAPVTIDLFKWEHTFDYWLASATLGRVLGFFILNWIFSGGLEVLVNTFIKKNK